MCRGRSALTSIASLACAGSAVAFLAAQAKPPAPPDTPSARNAQVIRVGVDLVQVDATVTDRAGRHVSDLGADDFEILQDGRPQRISTFTYVSGAAGPPAGTRPPPSPALPTPPPAADRVRRTIAIVVDDLGLSFESTARIRQVLRQFLDRQMQRGDLVAILRTGAGSGALQQFTTDRRILEAAVERIRWNMMARVSPFLAATKADEQLDAFRNELFSTGTLGAIRYIVRGIAGLPGRKSVVVLSDGFRLTDAHGDFGRVMDSLRALVDAANRAGVVIYSVDARGLMVTGPSAADPSPETAEARGEEIRATQDGLGYLADETGGVFIRNRNDLGAGVVRALEDQQGYYLLGYVPGRSTFESSTRFHRLTVRVKRPGLRVRSRKGFFGRPDTAGAAQTPANPMVAAVMSPFAGGEVRLRLSSFFGHHQKTGSYMLSVMHIDTNDLTFTAGSDGTRSGEIETLAVTFDEQGRVAGQDGRSISFRLEPAAYARALEAGFVYRIHVPLKRPGPYQLRIALRDSATGRIGSASQFVDAPDVRNRRLALSGLVIEGLAQSSQRAADDNAIEAGDPNATVALRRFRQGTETRYFCEIYNPRRRDGQPQLESATRLYRDGVEVFHSEPRAVAPPAADAPTPFVVGVLQLGNTIPPGSYVLEVMVTDSSRTGARRRRSTSRSWRSSVTRVWRLRRAHRRIARCLIRARDYAARPPPPGGGNSEVAPTGQPGGRRSARSSRCRSADAPNP